MAVLNYDLAAVRDSREATMAEEDVKATLAIGLLHGLINSRVVRLGTHSSKEEREENRMIFENIARMTEDFHRALFPPGRTTGF
jgi:hypothetical protein